MKNATWRVSGTNIVSILIALASRRITPVITFANLLTMPPADVQVSADEAKQHAKP